MRTEIAQDWQTRALAWTLRIPSRRVLCLQECKPQEACAAVRHHNDQQPRIPPPATGRRCTLDFVMTASNSSKAPAPRCAQQAARKATET